MLFVESRTLREQVDGATRTLLLEKLQERGLTPLVRSARLRLYELALLGSNRAHDMESAVAARTEIEGDAPYVRGDLFCFDDYAHYLVFADGAGGLRAGIIHEAEMADPREKLETFCQSVTEALAESRGNGASGNGVAASNGQDAQLSAPPKWGELGSSAPEVFTRFAAAAAEAPLFATRGEMVEGWLRTSGMLEDTEARRALRRLNEASREGPGHAYLAGDEREAVPEPLLAKFAEAGLVRRELLVSCRKDGRSLFRLPSPDALAVLSNAICSECGASIADEHAEEIIVPTSLVSTLLQDSSWLTTHLRAILSKQGVPEAAVAARAAGKDGEVHLMANVCGEPFLLLARDGDWTAAHARRALEEHAHAEGAHLVVVATGRVHDDARQRLREHARRRAHGGGGQDLIFVEGMDALPAELQPAFERVCNRTLSAALWELDTTLGMNVGFMIAARFRMLRNTGALRDLAASAASAVTGSLMEF